MTSALALAIPGLRSAKLCPFCGTAHARAAWQRLDFLGVASNDFEAREYRRCSCGSAISVSLGPANDVVEP